MLVGWMGSKETEDSDGIWEKTHRGTAGVTSRAAPQAAQGI